MGFVQVLLYPTAALSLDLISRFTSSRTPVSIVSAIYPIGLLLLVIYPNVEFRYRTKASLTRYIEFVKGAWYASIVTAILSMLYFLLVSRYDSGGVGWGFLFVSIGAVWLTHFLAAGSYAIILGDKEAADDFRRRIHQGKAYERAVAVFLSLLVGKYNMIRREPQVVLLLPSILFLYILGWSILSFAGGFPGTLLGLTMVFLFPLASYLYMGHTGRQNARMILSEVVVDSTANPRDG